MLRWVFLVVAALATIRCCLGDVDDLVINEDFAGVINDPVFLTTYDVALKTYVPPAALNGSFRDRMVLVSHATLDRLPAVVRWCQAWRGPMSVSVFVRPFIDSDRVVMSAFVSDACLATFAVLHRVHEFDHTYDRSHTPKEMIAHYPFNVQRNAALDGAVGGDWVFLVDIDLHLMPEQLQSEAALRRHVEAQRDWIQSTWTYFGARSSQIVDAAMFVIPAVETVDPSMVLPTTVDELKALVAQHAACPFYGHHCKHCHHPTNLRRFLTTNTPYLVEYEEGYEPYVILNRSAVSSAGGYRLPRYEELFVGRGKDKLSFFYEVAEQRRMFVTLPAAFLVHPGRGDNPLNPGEEYLIRVERNRRLYRLFKERMTQRYGSRVDANADDDGDGGTGGGEL